MPKLRYFFLCTIILLLLCSISCAEKTITITLAGDVTLGGEAWAQRRTDSFKAFYETNGKDYFFDGVSSLFDHDDITFVNLQGTLTNSTNQEDTGKTYRFRAPTSYVQILQAGSIEGVCVSNNHTVDFGSQGYTSTLDTLKKAGVGASARKEVYIWEGNGIKIAFFSLYASFVPSHKAWCEKEIARLKNQENVNAVVFSFHAGQEYAVHHNTSQKKMAEWAIKAGADLVVMHHPHIVQGVEIINSRYVFYSLGNFCFGGNVEVRALETMVLQAKLTFSDNGEYLGQQMFIYPAHTSGTYPSCNYQPILVTGSEAAEVIQLIQNDTKFALEPFDETLGCVVQPYLSADGSGSTQLAPTSNRHD